jgi:uncharacterized protein YndB with AHSA1/START domain
MERKQFKVMIDAPREAVWNTLWDDATYRQWTSVFSEGSHAETDWKKGSKILFLDGQGMGMVSRVSENIPNEYMSIEHLGIVKDGVEDLDSDLVKGWAGAHENYTLKTVNDQTELLVELDVDPNSEWTESLTNTFPRALNKVKEISEGVTV